MSTYTFVEKCKHCDAEAFYEEDYKTGEFWATCAACGWAFEALAVIGADNEIVTGPDGKITYTVTDNRAIGEDELPAGYLVIEAHAEQLKEDDSSGPRRPAELSFYDF